MTPAHRAQLEKWLADHPRENSLDYPCPICGASEVDRVMCGVDLAEAIDFRALVQELLDNAGAAAIVRNIKLNLERRDFSSHTLPCCILLLRTIAIVVGAENPPVHPVDALVHYAGPDTIDPAEVEKLRAICDEPVRVVGRYGVPFETTQGVEPPEVDVLKMKIAMLKDRIKELEEREQAIRDSLIPPRD